MTKPQRLHTDTDMLADSARGNSLKPRKGDIIVSTPVKSGTTWTQMLCALLVHQTPHVPQPLTVLSRWLDRLTEPIEEVVAHFEAQPFRRIIKTHTPLDALPYYDDVTYIFCGRDSRDVFLSMMDHLANISLESMADGFPVGSVMYLSQTYWRYRQLSNIVFLHYQDLSVNRDAEIRRL